MTFRTVFDLLEESRNHFWLEYLQPDGSWAEDSNTYGSFNEVLDIIEEATKRGVVRVRQLAAPSWIMKVGKEVK